MASVVYWGHVVAAAGAASVAFWLARRVRHNYDRPSAIWMWRLLAVLGLWGAVVALQLLAPTLSEKVVLLKVGTILGWGSLLLWFLFTLEFTGRGHLLTRRVKRGAAGLYGLLVGFVATDHVHGLLWMDFSLVDVGFTHLAYTESPYNVGIFAVLAGLAVVGFGLLVKSLLTSRQVSRRQLATVLAGFLLAAPSALVEFTDLPPAPHLEYGPMISILFFVAVAYGIVRHDLFVGGPFARDVVLESLEEGIVVVDRDGRVTDFNERARDVIPDLETAVGESFLAVAPEGIVVEGDVRTDGGFADALTDVFERPVDGAVRQFSIDVTPIARSGQLRGHAVVFRDQTEVEEYAARLERQTERLDRFASVVSHDLRNPLAVARGQLELARESGEPEAFERVDDALARMDAIIDDALELARSESEPVVEGPVSILDTARKAWRQTDTRTATLETTFSEGDRYVRADEERLMTLFENLFRNAVDHGPDDVIVRVEATEDGFAVEDTGPGIPKDRRDRVFERGFTTGEESTGLGLSIVETIATTHGWDVTATEGRDGGARFEITV